MEVRSVVLLIGYTILGQALQHARHEVEVIWWMLKLTKLALSESTVQYHDHWLESSYAVTNSHAFSM